MKLVFSLATVGVLALLVNAVISQAAVTSAGSQSNKPKVEIVCGGATQSDLHMNWYRDFDRFERNHPAIARDFSRDPLLVRSTEFRKHHTAWWAFLRGHPQLRAEIEANPGNYVVIPPRLAYVWAHARHSEHMLPSATKQKA